MIAYRCQLFLILVDSLSYAQVEEERCLSKSSIM